MPRSPITGTASFLGARAPAPARGGARRRRACVARGHRRRRPRPSHGVRHRMVDLTLPGADQRLVDVFREEHVDTVVHAAFFTTPRRDATYSHELESIGTLHLAAARRGRAACATSCCARSPRVYGARGPEPELPHRGPAARRRASRLAWVRDKVEAEEHAFSFARRYPALGVTVLRFAPLLGPGRPHVLHAHLQQAGRARRARLRPARAVPAPRRRARRARRGASPGGRAASSTSCPRDA